jgi:aminomethyltransferase
LELDGRRIARQHYQVYGKGRPVGEVTSGTLSPTLGKSIAMALIAGEFAEPATDVEVQIGSRRTAARVVALPFYKRPK